MKKSDEMLRLEKNMMQDKEFVRKFDLAAKEALESGECKCDGEVLVKAAASLGYKISLSELERMDAENEKLDSEEMEMVSGGAVDPKYDEWCWKDFGCAINYHVPNEDEDGHHYVCLTAYHCFTALLHTDNTDDKKVACWSNYRCIALYEDGCE